MKKIFILSLFTLLHSQKDYNTKDLVIFEDKFLIKFSDEIVNGDVYTTYTGIKVKNGRIIRGTKDGTWVDWHETGTKKLEYNLLDGFLSGGVKMWNEKGKLIASGNYVKGNGTTIIQNLYPDSFPTNGRDGSWKFYFEDGNLKQDEEWRDGLLLSEKSFYRDSKRVKYEAVYGERNSDPDKKIILDYIGSIDIPIGSYTGLKTFYYRSGNVFSVQQWDWVQNRPYGNSTFYHESGELWMEIQYNEKGKKHGYLKHYFLGKLYKKYFYNKDHIVNIHTFDINGEIEYTQDCVFKFCKEPTLATLE